MEDVCLYDFVSKYYYAGKDEDGARKYKLLNKPRLPNHKIFNPEKEDQKEAYYYSLLLLFVPFRDESELLEDDETAEEAFKRLVTDNSKAYHEKLHKALQAQATVKEINEARRAEAKDEKEEKDNKEDDEPQLMGEANSAMNDLMDLNANNADDKSNQFSLDERVSMLNVDQRRIFENVKSHLVHQKQHEAGVCNCDHKPHHMFVSGVGGTGKSFLIETIKALVCEEWPSKDITCAIIVSTGLAAFNVGGATIHRLFQLPVEHDSKTAGYWSLPKSSQKVMRSTLRSVKLFVIDEVSMVSSLNLAYIHLRLEELFGGNEWFGSKNMLFVGDILQLQPVNGNPVFLNISQTSLVYKLGCGVRKHLEQLCSL